MFNYIDLLVAMGFAWIVSGIILLIINRKRNSTQAWPGSLLIFVIGLTLLDNFIKPEMLPDSIVRIIFIISRNSYFLIGPFLFFYTRSLLLKNNTSPWNLLHILPFLAMAIYTAITPSTMYPDEIQPDMLASMENLIPAVFRDIFSILSRALYCLAVFRLIHNHAKTVPDFYSRKTMRNTLSWLYYLVAFYLALFIFNFLLLMLPTNTGFLAMLTRTLVRLAPSLLFIFLFSIFAQNQPVPEVLKSAKTSGDIKYNNSGITASESEQLFKKLNAYLTESRLFIEPDLTLNLLAEQMGETRHRLSEVINRESGENFYSYVNTFRLKEFLSAVQENKYPHFTILAIAYECGFKSQSAFYDLFKKKTGLTPREYMKKLA